MSVEDVTKMHREISIKAARYANEMMREQFLVGNDAPAAFASRLAVLKKRNAAIMSYQWSPFMGDGGKRGFALRLRPGDALLLADFGEMAMDDTDHGLMTLHDDTQVFSFAAKMTPNERMQKIATDAILRALSEDRKARHQFAKAIVRDLFSDTPFYRLTEGSKQALKTRRSGS